MKKTIKHLFTLLLFISINDRIYAQMDTVFVDSILLNVPFQKMVDSCFEHVDLDQVPTGLLLEHAYPTVDVKVFDGTVNDSTYANTYVWRRAYGTLPAPGTKRRLLWYP